MADVKHPKSGIEIISGHEQYAVSVLGIKLRCILKYKLNEFSWKNRSSHLFLTIYIITIFLKL